MSYYIKDKKKGMHWADSSKSFETTVKNSQGIIIFKVGLRKDKKNMYESPILEIKKMHYFDITNSTFMKPFFSK